MTLGIRLLGRPSIERSDGASYRLRSRKSWALLAYLVLSEAAPTRSQLAGLLFGEADDPLRALRWSLAEIRRCLGRRRLARRRPRRAAAPGGHRRRRRDPHPRDLGRRRRGGRPRRRAAGRCRGPRRAGLRVVAALRAATSRGRCRGCPARGGGGSARPGCPRPSAWVRRTRGRDEPARREPPGAADPALPTGRRGHRGRGAVRRLDRAARRASWASRRARPSRWRCANDRSSASQFRPRPASRRSSRRVRRPSPPARSSPASPPCAVPSDSPTPAAAPDCGCGRARCSPRR